MPQTVIGLDIGATSIKITRLEASLFSFTFQDSSEHPLSTHMNLPWEQSVSNVLEVLFSDRGLRPEKIIASVPGRYVSTRILTLPFTDRRKIEQTIPFELEGQVPFPIEEVLIDYQVLETGPDGSKILVLCTPKKALEGYLGMLKQSGIDPQVLIPPAVSLGNLHRQVQGGRQEPFAIIDIGDDETAVCLVSQGQLRFCRTLITGSSGLTRDIEEAMGISRAEATEIKEKEADVLPSPTSGGDSRRELLASVLLKSLRPLVGGIQQSLVSAQETVGIRPQRIYVCGRGAKLVGLQKYLAKELNYEVLDLEGVMTLGPSQVSDQYDPFTFAASIGLALHGTRDNAASRFNLRSGEYTYVSGRKALQKNIFSAGVMLAALLLLFLLNQTLKYHYRHQENQRIQAAIDQVAQEIFPDIKHLPGGKQRVSALTAKLEEEKREWGLFANISSESVSALDILLAITKAVPQEVKIDVRELIMEGDKVRIQGETSSSNAAEEIKNNLLQSGLFANAEIPEIKDSLDHSTVKFQMILQLQSRAF